MMRFENLKEYFYKGRLLEAMAARKRLEAWTDEYVDRRAPERRSLDHIIAQLPEEHAV